MKLFNYFRTLARRQKIGEYVERQYAAAAGGRLTSDWMAGGSSEDTELAGSLETMRTRQTCNASLRTTSWGPESGCSVW